MFKEVRSQAVAHAATPEDVYDHYAKWAEGHSCASRFTSPRACGNDFHLRKLELSECGGPYGTPCKHEHGCIRCPSLRVDLRARRRLVEIIANLRDRIQEAHLNGWQGEATGLQVSLHEAKPQADAP